MKAKDSAPVLLLVGGMLVGFWLHEYVKPSVEQSAPVVADGTAATELPAGEANMEVLGIKALGGKRAPLVWMTPGPIVYPLDGGKFSLRLYEPEQDGRDGVRIKATLTNNGWEGKIRPIYFLEKGTSAADDFGNTYFACQSGSGLGGCIHRFSLYPHESVELGWYYAKPVPGATVTYRFALNDRIGYFKRTWPGPVPTSLPTINPDK